VSGSLLEICFTTSTASSSMWVISLVVMIPKGNKGENYIIRTVALSPQSRADQDKFQYIVYSRRQRRRGRERESWYFNDEHRARRNRRTSDIYSEAWPHFSVPFLFFLKTASHPLWQSFILHAYIRGSQPSAVHRPINNSGCSENATQSVSQSTIQLIVEKYTYY
jgi:hypothetical protein